MSDFNDISRLQEEQEKTLKNCESMIEKWEKFKEDYEGVEKLLSDLPKKTTHDVMVPIGPLAFMPGKLIHTNEIMVLLGDNWFAERSATQAVEIAKRRLRSVEEYLGNLRKEHENILSHMAFTSNFVDIKNQNDFQEIKEELTEKDLQRQERRTRRVAHAKATKDSVKKVDLQSNSISSQPELKDDENLFARLDELERQEQLNEELENEEHFDTDSTTCNSSWKEEGIHAERMYKDSPICETLPVESKIHANSASNVSTYSDKEHAQNPSMVRENNRCTLVDKQNTHETKTHRSDQGEGLHVADTCDVVKANNLYNPGKKDLGKKVKWKENIVEEECGERVAYPKEEDATIYFTHSTEKVAPKEIQEDNITSPADILKDYLNKKECTAQHPLSILKNSKEVHSKEDRGVPSKHTEIKSTDTSSTMTLDEVTRKEKDLTPQAYFGDVIVEHKDAPNTGIEKEQKPETRKVSKFKARRMKTS